MRPTCSTIVMLTLVIGCGSPASSLVRVELEPEGANCVEGGLAIHTGVDSDSDRVLDDVEITETEYLCNGGGGEVECTGGNIVVGTQTVRPPEPTRSPGSTASMEIY